MVTMCQAWLTADFLPIYHEAREGRESLDHRRRGRESLPERQILGIFDPHKNWLDDGIAPLPASLFEDPGHVLRLIQFVKIF